MSTRDQVQNYQYEAALRDFRSARRKAALQQVFSRFQQKPEKLLSFDEVRSQLGSSNDIRRELKTIPLDAIVGSVGRYTDFTRDFLPRRDNDAERWAKVKALMLHGGGLPPIEVYKVGEVYFVLDGNHRVSVAQHIGNEEIEAYVTEIDTLVPISVDDNPDDLIIKAELTDFLQNTRLHHSRPEADLKVTLPGQYRLLQRQIAEFHENLIQTGETDIAREESAARWYDDKFNPVIRVVKEMGLLRDFPGRTETDLYVWLFNYRDELEEELGYAPPLETIAMDLVSESSPKREHRAARVAETLADTFIPSSFEPGPKTGSWRKETLKTHSSVRLFSDFLVPISGTEASWQGLEQALVLAKSERDHVQGLHVIPKSAARNTPKIQQLRAEFKRRCKEAGIDGELVVDRGKVSRKICSHARWADMVVINLEHPPGAFPVAKLASGMHNLIRTSSRPILAVPKVSSKIERLLLAYDGSPKSKEALFITAYWAGKWGQSVDVLTVNDDENTARIIQHFAMDYLRNRKIKAHLHQASGPVAPAVMELARVRNDDVILMGGYGYTPVLEFALGSAVDQVLRESDRPVLFCR